MGVLKGKLIGNWADFLSRTGANVPFSRGLATDRLRLRRLTGRDATTIEKLLSNWEVTKQTPIFPHPYTRRHAAEFIAAAENDWTGGQEFVLGLEHLESKELIGVISVSIHRRWIRRTGEVGYWLGEDYWGEGYATEAVRTFLAFCHRELNLSVLTARVFEDNDASRRLLTNQGFSVVRVQTVHLRERGGMRKILHMKKTYE